MKNQAGYSQFLIIQLGITLLVIDDTEPYDDMWAKGGQLLAKFEKSSHNIVDETEYDCMCQFLETQKRFDE